MPRQFKNEAEFVSLQSTLDNASSVMQSQFAFTFALNLLLNGVMSQLWNIFNTLQIIMALPMLQVQIPGNIVLVQEMLLSIINFQIVSKEQISEVFIDPIMSDDKGSDPDSPGEDENSTRTQYLGSSSMIKAVFLYFFVFLLVALLIALLLLCKCYVIPKCPSCIQKVA